MYGFVTALLGVYGEFNRTPKGEDGRHSGKPRINQILLAGEVVTFGYSLLAIWVAILDENYFLVPLNLTVCVGFGMVLYWSWVERYNTKITKRTQHRGLGKEADRK